jgi:hypothetical protein
LEGRQGELPVPRYHCTPVPALAVCTVSMSPARRLLVPNGKRSDWRTDEGLC